MEEDESAVGRWASLIIKVETEVPRLRDTQGRSRRERTVFPAANTRGSASGFLDYLSFFYILSVCPIFTFSATFS